MSIGVWQVILILLVVVLLFGRGKISELMGDVAKGIKSFKKGLNEDETAAKEDDPKVIENTPQQSAETARSEQRNAS